MAKKEDELDEFEAPEEKESPAEKDAEPDFGAETEERAGGSNTKALALAVIGIIVLTIIFAILISKGKFP